MTKHHIELVITAGVILGGLAWIVAWSWLIIMLIIKVSA